MATEPIKPPETKRPAPPKPKPKPKPPKPKPKPPKPKPKPKPKNIPAPPIVNPPSGKKKTTEYNAFLWAEGEQESGNDYGAVNRSSGALGRWQVMPSNLPTWLRASGLPPMTPSEYLANHTAQNILAETILGGDFYRYGPRGAAAVWYSGQPDPNATYGNPPVYQYVDDVIALMAKAPQGGYTLGIGPAGTGTAPPGFSFQKVPAPGKDDWSPDIHLTVVHVTDLSNTIQNHTAALAKIGRK